MSVFALNVMNVYSCVCVYLYLVGIHMRIQGRMGMNHRLLAICLDLETWLSYNDAERGNP